MPLQRDVLAQIEEKEAYWREVEQDVISCLVNKGDTAIDVGANTGSYIRTLLEYGCNCIAFECNPPLYDTLISRFATADNVKIRPEAVSSEAGCAQMRIPLEGTRETDGWSTIEPLNPLQGFSAVKSVNVSRCRLDDVVHQAIALIKIDVEGHEIEALKGATRLLGTQHPAVIVECEDRHRPGATTELFKLMERFGYVGFFIEQLRLREVSEFGLGMQDLARLRTGIPRRDNDYVNNFIFIHQNNLAKTSPAIRRKLALMRLGKVRQTLRSSFLGGLKKMVRAAARGTYFILRPFLRPVLWRLRHFLLGPIEGRLGAIEGRLDAIQRRLVEVDISTTPVLVRDLGVTPTYLTHNLTYPIFNPSVVRLKDEILFVSRSSNHSFGRELRRVISSNTTEPRYTVNIFHRYDSDLNLIGSEMLDDELLRHKCKAAEYGIEDIRLFTWRNALWGIAAAVHGASNGDVAVSQLLVRLDRCKVVDFVELSSPNKARWEKNWVPLVKEDRLFIIYSFEPMVVYEYLDRKIVPVRGSPSEGKEFSVSGGTPLIHLRGYYVGLAHSYQGDSHRRHITHNIVVLNDNFEIVEMSCPFFLQRKGIEFACGLIEYRQDLLVSYGISDSASAFCVLPSKRLAQWVVSMI